MPAETEQTGDGDDSTDEYSDPSETGQQSGKGSGLLARLLL